MITINIHKGNPMNQEPTIFQRSQGSKMNLAIPLPEVCGLRQEEQDLFHRVVLPTGGHCRGRAI